MFCPVCRGEYREGFTHCNDCDVDLVGEPDQPSALTPVAPAPSDERRAARTSRALLCVAGIIVGVFVTLGTQQGVRYWRRHHVKTSTILFIWAYDHVPQAVGIPSPRAARTLDAEFQNVGNQANGDVRIVYENDGAIRLIKAKYRVEGGQVVSPTDDQLRQLDASAASLPR